MLWYDDSCVENAVSKVKSTASFLLVFVKGYDDLSNEYEFCLDRIKGLNETCIALKLSHDSTALQQFKEIYIKVPIPSVFLIQNNGIPLCVVSTDKISEICSAIIETVNLKSKLEEKKNVENAVAESTIKDVEKPISKPLEYAKNIGYKIADVSEDELQQRLSEIRAFPRFLLIDSSSDLQPEPLFPPISVLQPPKIHSARIQFRLPNNETPSWEFPDLSTLKDVRAYITEKINLPSNFKFMRTYPRTTISPKDENRTLSDLSLTPNATLIVVPVKVEDKNIQAGSGTTGPFFLFTLLNAFWLPLFTLIKFLKKHIFGEREIENEVNSSEGLSTNPGKIPNTQKFGSNIHGFKFDRDDSDGEHPDNGNSTQQSYHKK